MNSCILILFTLLIIHEHFFLSKHVQLNSECFVSVVEYICISMKLYLYLSLMIRNTNKLLQNLKHCVNKLYLLIHVYAKQKRRNDQEVSQHRKIHIKEANSFPKIRKLHILLLLQTSNRSILYPQWKP